MTNRILELQTLQTLGDEEHTDVEDYYLSMVSNDHCKNPSFFSWDCK